MYKLMNAKPRVKVSKNMLEERARKMRTQVNTLEATAIARLKANKIPHKHEVVFGFYILIYLYHLNASL